MSFRMPPDLMELLADPETHERVNLANEEQLVRLRAAISKGAARRRDGEKVPSSIEAAFLSRHGKCAYLVVDGVPNFLVQESLEIDEAIE